MRYPAEETAEKHRKILLQASILFRERGFSGVSVSEIMKATGLTHGTFYHHFESKDALITESLSDASSRALASMQDAKASTELMHAFIQEYLTEAHRDNKGVGCLMTALGAEVAREPLVRPTLTHHIKSMIEIMAAPFAAAKKRNTRRKAIHQVTSMVGAIILARAVDDPELSEEILREVRDELSD
ncbi:TetR/AcrR family transcriptional regulator [Pseudomonas gingeri]|uniref:TetR/AcrR family transcriptional regulator n=1 Tax=Pseudomonas gingeri TaxID=117681 RepID=A0A7Y7XAT6_9PSED|nr:TetR/AcrR family transcriptional regulator [Pseudomonas gingeri]NWB96464.1 TetR/AcrR family transcriptional regulator [Pseudomonas gingeri]